MAWAKCQQNRKWCQFDDDHVRELNEEELGEVYGGRGYNAAGSRAYMFFYVRLEENQNGNQSFQQTRDITPAGVGPHPKYHERYWLTNKDIDIVLEACLGRHRERVQSAVSYDALIKRVGKILKNKQTGKMGWRTQITNCSSSKGKGIHWILTSVFHDEPR